MDNKKIIINLKNIANIAKERIKQRYMLIIVLTIITIFFSYFYKDLKYRENYKIDDGKAQIVSNETIMQKIHVEYNEPIELCINVGKNNPTKSTKYNISIENNDESIVDIDIDTLDLEQEQLISLMLPKLDNVKGKDLTLKISSNNVDPQNALIIYTGKADKETMLIDKDQVSNVVYTRITYPKFHGIYPIALVLLYVSCCILVLGIDVKKVHNSIFAIILLTGMFTVAFNPVLDTPDDHAHIARADLTSQGILFVTGDISKYKVSNSVRDILLDNYSTLQTTTLFNSEVDSNQEYQASNYANTNLFIGYIPQTLGILLGKLIGLNSFMILILGKLFNLIAYALMVRFAIKIAPMFKVPLGLIAIMPMAIFIASSFNPDATTYGLGFLCIGYFLHLYKKENISIKEIAIYSTLSIVLGLVKLPYCILGGLIIFLPKSKFINNKTYYKSFLFVLLVALVSLGWGGFAIINSAVSPFNSFYEVNNIDIKGQIMYILNDPVHFVKIFSVALLDNIGVYLQQLNTFGWLSYGLNAGSMILYSIFMGSVVLLYPNKEILGRKTKYGIMIVAVGVYAVTCFILFLSWTPVESSIIEGVQGRYLVPLIGLLTLLSNGKVDKDNDGTTDLKFLFTGLIFVIIFIITMMNKYY
ncbi:DUF2142 domain-containing protein [Clostridium vincentii]|uniref:DUF2142 domain-containing protein n=1 Tax=Clostridium vincentii TaxID=52704 RepID=A0A2T0BGN5_9CLOT|nr:DUF2142 domain-containing protein [Clostridium vincentii]PRR83045.1 hypothetical protein CLVI_12940 [Clostridium vincentii]